MESIRLDLLDLFGSGYVIEHCISALRQKRQDEAWRHYIADSLYYSGRNKVLTVRYADLFKAPDGRTGDEIAADIIRRSGLVVIE